MVSIGSFDASPLDSRHDLGVLRGDVALLTEVGAEVVQLERGLTIADAELSRLG